jgi:hypothetical protein
VGFDEGVRNKERKGRKAGWMKGLKGEWEVKTRAQNDKKTKRARSQGPRHSQHHPKLPPPLPLNPPSSTPSTPDLLVRCHRSRQPRRVKEGKALVGERTAFAHTRPRRASGRCGIEATGLVSKRGEGGGGGGVIDEG